MFPYALSHMPRRWLLLAFLLTLYLVCLLTPQSQEGRWLFLAHIGLALVWQPFVQPRRRIGPVAGMSVVALAALYAFFLDWLPLLLWAMLLIGVIGGKVFLYPGWNERVFHLLALGVLVLLILAWILPEALASHGVSEPEIVAAAQLLAPLCLALMVVLPVGAPPRGAAEVVDYVYGVLVFLLVAVVVLGSLTLTLLLGIGYVEAMLLALAITAALLLALGFMWNPQAGFGGLKRAMSQHMRALNQPLERWIETLAELDRKQAEPDDFLREACECLGRQMPGVVGGRWQTEQMTGTFGELSLGWRFVFAHAGLQMELLARLDPDAALRWDYDLAVRLLAERFEAKRRAKELVQLTYLAAIHETGARLTHEIKNLLQSLQMLCDAASRADDLASPSFHALLRRQLPEVVRRLSQALAKLGAPTVPNEETPTSARQWLEALAARYAAAWLRCEMTTDDFLLDQPTLFLNVAENLLQNLYDKRRSEPQLTGCLTLSPHLHGACLEVCDDGAPLPASLATRLFHEPAPSEQGLGIGLYQCARVAARHGYRLTLRENRAGRVCFALVPQPPAQERTQAEDVKRQ